MFVLNKLQVLKMCRHRGNVWTLRAQYRRDALLRQRKRGRIGVIMNTQQQACATLLKSVLSVADGNLGNLFVHEQSVPLQSRRQIGHTR